MSPSANVLAIHALEELKGALGHFGGEAQAALRTAEQEIRRTLEWLQERQAHWQREVRRRQEKAQAEVWDELKGDEADEQCDRVSWMISLGERQAKKRLRRLYPDLPEYA